MFCPHSSTRLQPLPFYRLAITFFFLFMLNVTANAADQIVNKNWRSIAIKGYDPVAYFTMGKAVKGKSKHEVKWHDAKWRFASAEHRDLFSENPNQYAPRFGGYCTGSMALGRKGDINPQAWIIVKGKLFLDYDKEGRDRTAANPEKIIREAEKNWKTLGKAANN